MTAQVVRRLGGPGVLVHGVSLKPGKPTILAVCDGKAGLRPARQSGLVHGDVRPVRGARRWPT